VDDSLYSPTLARHMVWLSGLVPSYAAAAEVYQRVSGQLIPRVSLWRQTQQQGKRLKAYVQRQQEHVRPERVGLPLTPHAQPQRKGVSMDGGMVHIRGEGWKEFKVGTVFDIQRRWEREPQTGELAERPHAAQIASTATLGSVNAFAPALWALAVERGIPQADHTSVTADGAAWIWNLVADYFPDSLQIVDCYHASQHLALAASALFPDDPARHQRWYNQRLDLLFQGAAPLIATELQAAGLPEHALYFHTHQRRMQYQEFRELGYPIGSGTTESAVKQFKMRLTGPGMQWNAANLDTMLVIRGAVLADTFDALWDAAA
jgi:hypothetical protein